MTPFSEVCIVQIWYKAKVVSLARCNCLVKFDSSQSYFIPHHYQKHTITQVSTFFYYINNMYRHTKLISEVVVVCDQSSIIMLFQFFHCSANQFQRNNQLTYLL